MVKRYLEKASEDIIVIGQTLEEHTKKVVQMHYLARNFAAKLKEELIASDNEILFGETMSYKKIYMGTIDGEYVTVEEFRRDIPQIYQQQWEHMPRQKC